MRPGILLLGIIALASGCGGDNQPTRVVDAGVCAEPTLPAVPGDCADLRGYIHTVGLLNTDGDAAAVALVGGYACIADGDGGVVVVEACDPSQMRAVGRWDAGTGVHDIAPLRSRLYVATDEGLSVLDFSDPRSPEAIVSRDGVGASRGIVVDPLRRLAFVADDVIGLFVYDIAAPFAPTVLGIENTAGRAMDVCVEANVAYVADAVLGLRIVSVESPEDPWLIANVETPGQAGGVAVWRGLAVVADGNAGLTVVDVSSPVAARVVGRFDTVDGVTAVAVAAGLAYVTERASGLLVFDLADPSAPALVARVSGEGSAQGLAVSGDVVVVAEGSAGIRAIDVRSPQSPPVLARLTPPGGSANALLAAGDRVYVADGNLGLTVGEWNGSGLVRRGGVGVGGTPQRMTMYQGALYVCADNAGVRVVDVADPDNPVLVGELPGTSGAVDVAFADSVAFTVRGGLTPPAAFDLRRPGDLPVALAITGGVVRAVDVGEFYAYFVQIQGKLWVASLDPTSSQSVHSQLTKGRSTDVQVREYPSSGSEQLFVSNRQGIFDSSTGIDFSAGVEVYDLTDPLMPAFVTLIETSIPAERIAFRGHIMYVAGEADGLEVFDISDPLAPVAIGSYWQNEPIRDAAAVPGAMLLAAAAGGIIALPPTCE